MASELARAKVNLTLHVGRLSNAALHPLESLVVFADFGDALEAITAQEFSLTISGPFSKGLSASDDNLIFKAAHLANKNLKLPGVAFHLVKNLPVASGIGGGSADAAAAIRAMETLAGRSANLTAQDMMIIGADVPVCYLSQSCVMSGAGEAITPRPSHRPLPALLVNPGVAVSTAQIFKRFDAATPDTISPRRHNLSGDITASAKAGANDLQRHASELAPQINRVLEMLALQNGVILSRMSGSGATCFALFETFEQAQIARQFINKTHPDWWAQETHFGGALDQAAS